MSKQPWALILGAGSGFGEATALELARAGMNIFGVHLDASDRLPHVEEMQAKIRAGGRDAEFFNVDAVDDSHRADTVALMRQRLIMKPEGTLRVLLHSLSSGMPGGALRPLAGAEQVASKWEIEGAADRMGHSLVYWVQDCLRAGLFDWGGRIFAMTSMGGGAPKAALEAHVRQLALDLAPAGITANAILAGVVDTPDLRLVPGHEKLIEAAKARNPHRRLTAPEDVARCIAALCHPATYWMTGNTIHVDGGENIAV